MGLRKALLERNFPDLPSGLDWGLVEESKLGLQRALERKYGDDTARKIKGVQRLLEKFQDGSLPKILRHKENLVAATAVFVDLNGEEITK